ncbi:MAG: beta-lactamase family protein [Cyclobacteriaceae bacterium]
MNLKKMLPKHPTAFLLSNPKNPQVCLYLVIVLLFGCQSSKNPSSTNPNNATTAEEKVLIKIDSTMNSYIESNQLAGIATMTMKEGKVIQEKAYGYADIESKKELKKTDIFRIYSMTKPIVSLAILKLLEEGKFKLDDPISQYAPEFKDLMVYENGQTVEPERALTFRHLFTHTSGFSYGWGSSYVDSLYRTSELLMPNGNLKEKVAKLVTIPLKSHPGTKWEYSISIDVLGYMIEVLSGQELDQYLKENIFNPLEMVDTDFYTPKEKINRLTTVYGKPNGELSPIEHPSSSRFTQKPILLSGGGGLVSTMQDYANFCQMVLNKGEFNGKQILAPSTIEMASQNQMPNNMEAWEGVGYALGFAVALNDSPNQPKGLIWWGGAADTHFWIDPVNDLFMLAFAQHQPQNQIPFFTDYKKLIYEYESL